MVNTRIHLSACDNYVRSILSQVSVAFGCIWILLNIYMVNDLNIRIDWGDCIFCSLTVTSFCYILPAGLDYLYL